MGMTFKRQDSLEKLFDQFAIDPTDEQLESNQQNKTIEKKTDSIDQKESE